MKTNVLFLNFSDAPSEGYWCTNWIEEMVYQPGFVHHTSPTTLPEGEGAIVIIPAEYNHTHVPEINSALLELPWSVVILASDERGLFPVENLCNYTSLWVMTPHFEKHIYPEGTNFIGEFYPQQARECLKAAQWHRERPYKAAFSGQITHQRREELAQSMKRTTDNSKFFFNGTAGFTQGLGHSEYFQTLVKAVTVPAPSGPETLDSFRAFEALESGAIPLLDLNCPRTQNGHRYWSAVLGADHPLPMISHWDEMFEVIESLEYPRDNNRVFAWWQLFKRETRRRILADVPGFDNGRITVLMPTSPIGIHPSVEIIEETVESIRHHLPDAEILIMIDGVRPEQEHYRAQYEEYIYDLLWHTNFIWHNVTPVLFNEHHHQANMTRRALELVDTPNILFVEHDTPLVTDRPIAWTEICDLIGKGVIDMLRFHFQGHVDKEHEWLMIDKNVRDLEGVHLRMTRQWSQRPHIASTSYYRRIIRQHFPHDARTMIEDKMHSVVLNNQNREAHRVALYCPQDPDGHIVRSYHLDGRGTDEKFEMEYGTE